MKALENAVLPATLEVRNLCTSFHTRDGILPAVRDVSLRLQPGRILGAHCRLHVLVDLVFQCHGALSRWESREKPAA